MTTAIKTWRETGVVVPAVAAWSVAVWPEQKPEGPWRMTDYCKPTETVVVVAAVVLDTVYLPEHVITWHLTCNYWPGKCIPFHSSQEAKSEAVYIYIAEKKYIFIIFYKTSHWSFTLIIILLLECSEQKVESTCTRRWETTCDSSGLSHFSEVSRWSFIWGIVGNPFYRKRQMVVPCTNHHKGRGTVYDETFWILAMMATFGHAAPSQAASFRWVLDNEWALWPVQAGMQADVPLGPHDGADLNVVSGLPRKAYTSWRETAAPFVIITNTN